MIFNNILFKKTIICKAKLQHIRQETFNHCCCSRAIKNLREKRIFINNLYESQELDKVSNHQAVESKINQIIRIIEAI